MSEPALGRGDTPPAWTSPIAIHHADDATTDPRFALTRGLRAAHATGLARAEALEAWILAAGAENLDGKVLLDVSNPLDATAGMPPPLFVSNTDSLAEQIQRAFSGARVSFVTMASPASIVAFTSSGASFCSRAFCAGVAAASMRVYCGDP